MKKKLLLIFVFLFSSLIFAETNGSLKNRVGRMPEEWNELCSYLRRFRNEDNWTSYVNLSNYMMGFAEAMYKDCEYLYDLYQGDYLKGWLSDQYNFYFEEFQGLWQYCGPKTMYFRSYYYNAGFSRVDKGASKFGYYDF